MHAEQVDFIRRAISWYDESIRTVIDCGSLDINGNNRLFFPYANYIGLDVGPGPNVDVIGPCHEYPGTAQCVISGEMLEHDRYWQLSIPAMVKMAEDLLIITCATTGRKEHGTNRVRPGSSPHTTDFYHPVSCGEFLLCLDTSQFRRWTVEVRETDLYFAGVK